MKIPLFQVDAFADGLFQGNPAAVVPLESWLPDALLQAIALENNLSETAYIVGAGGSYELRWFTPGVEVALCGHATLGAAWVVSRRMESGLDTVRFRTRSSGELTVDCTGDALRMDLPAIPARPVAADPAVDAALGTPVRELHGARCLVAVLQDEAAVRAVVPDMSLVAALPWHGVVVTAVDGPASFVSRYFVPASGIPEDPVTGSTHCTLAPFWAERLGRNPLVGRQLSRRGGRVDCDVQGDRVWMAGRVVPYMEGFIELPDGLELSRAD